MSLHFYYYITGYIGQRKLTINLTRVKEMIQEGLANITPKHWSDCVDHVKQVENVYWASDIAQTGYHHSD